jgi:transcriptional regulator PpsR
MQPDVKVLLDPGGMIRHATLANTVADEPVEGWVGQRWAETVVGIDDARLSGLVETALSQGVSPFFRLTQRFPSGITVPIEYMAVRLKGGNLLAIGRDVRAVAQLQSRLAAAQHAMERNYWQLREAENRYRLLFETSSDALAVVRASDLSITEANPAAITALGLAAGQPTEIGGQRFLALARPSERQMLELTFGRATEHGKAPRVIAHLGPAMQAWVLYVSLLDVDQAEFLLVHLLPADEGRTTSSGGFAPPLSADHLLGLAPDGFVALDDQGYVSGANPAFLELVQEGAVASVIGRSIADWLRPPGGDVDLLLEGLRRNRTVRLFPSTLYGSLGGRMTVEVSAVASDLSQPSVILVCVRDVSRRLDGSETYAPLVQALGSMAEQLGITTLKELVGITVGLVEQHYIEAALATADGNRTAAAKILGLSRQGLYIKLARYGINEGGDGR